MKATFIVMILLACTMLGGSSHGITTQSSVKSNPQPRVVTADYDNFIFDSPTRPKDSAKIVATVGRVIGYHLLVTRLLLSPRIIIWDERARAIRTFSLSFHTAINGVPLQCEGAVLGNPLESGIFLRQAIAENHLCRQLPPNIVIGKTRVVIVYWHPIKFDPHKFMLLYVDQLPHSDALFTIP